MLCQPVFHNLFNVFNVRTYGTFVKLISTRVGFTLNYVQYENLTSFRVPTVRCSYGDNVITHNHTASGAGAVMSPSTGLTLGLDGELSAPSSLRKLPQNSTTTVAIRTVS